MVSLGFSFLSHDAFFKLYKHMSDFHEGHRSCLILAYSSPHFGSLTDVFLQERSPILLYHTDTYLVFMYTFLNKTCHPLLAPAFHLRSRAIWKLSFLPFSLPMSVSISTLLSNVASQFLRGPVLHPIHAQPKPKLKISRSTAYGATNL